jgi:hypothetical protein
MTSYTVENFKSNGEQITERVLTAKTDLGARRQAKKYMSVQIFANSDIVKLVYHKSDGTQRTLETLKERR